MYIYVYIQTGLYKDPFEGSLLGHILHGNMIEPVNEHHHHVEEKPPAHIVSGNEQKPVLNQPGLVD